MDCNEEVMADDFSFMDARRLCKLLLPQQAQTDKKRRWLASMISEPGVDRISRKRPKFLKDDYLAESDVRSDEVSSERVKVNVERSFGLQSNCYNHHVVQDGVLLFELLKGKGGPVCPESLRVMLCTISKLSNAALHSVATIATHEKLVFKKSRVSMKKIAGEHLPKYMAELDKEDSGLQLYKILTNPCSYLSDSVRLTTPVTPTLLSSIDQALVELDKMSEQALVAMNRKLRKASRAPIFLHESRSSTKYRVVRIVRKRCERIIQKLLEGVDLPENLAKALSIMNLYWKSALRSMDIPQSEFFPFSRGTMSVQNDVLHAIWSLQEVSSNGLKLLRPILGQVSRNGSKINTASFRVYVRRYLTECLFECDGSKLPDKALRTIAFLNRMSPKQHQVLFTEEKKEEEAEAVLNLSSCLKSLAHSETEECLSDDEVSLESDICSEDNDFVFTETNYFNVRSQQQMDEGCCSNFMTVEDSEDPGGAGQYIDSEFAGSTMEAYLEEDNVKTNRCSEDLSVVCDETASVAYKLIGEILKNMLLEEEVDELTGRYLGEDSISQDSQAAWIMLGGYWMVVSCEDGLQAHWTDFFPLRVESSMEWTERPVTFRCWRPRTVKQIFDTMERQETEYSGKVTFLELYNEEITDLAPEEISRVAAEDWQKNKGFWRISPTWCLNTFGRQKELVDVRLSSLGDAARGNKNFLDEQTSAMEDVTKRKWEMFAEQAVNDFTVGSKSSGAKHCRMEVILQECAYSAAQQWKKSHAAVNDLCTKQVAEVEALVRSAIECNEKHDAEIASSRAVAEEHASNSSKDISTVYRTMRAIRQCKFMWRRYNSYKRATPARLQVSSCQHARR